MISVPVAILAGGLATRLRPITETIPKSLVPVAGEPFLAHQLRCLRSQGVCEVVLCVGHLGGMIEERFKNGSKYGVHLRYSYDGARPLGTGGALRRALPFLGDHFFAMYGDSYLLISFESVLECFYRKRKLGLMTIFPNFSRWETSNILFESGEIRKYSKRDLMPEMQHVDYGLSVFKAQVFNYMVPFQSYDLADTASELAARGELAGYVADRRFYEIGSPAGLNELDQWLKTGNEL